MSDEFEKKKSRKTKFKLNSKKVIKTKKKQKRKKKYSSHATTPKGISRELISAQSGELLSSNALFRQIFVSTLGTVQILRPGEGGF